MRSCNIEHGYSSCAECVEFADVNECKKFNNAIARMIGFVLRSDRAGCIAQIKSVGIEGHAQRMARLGRQSLKR